MNVKTQAATAPVILTICMCVTGCGPKRSVQGPWEYPELSQSSMQNVSSRVGAYGRDPSTTQATKPFGDPDGQICLDPEALGTRVPLDTLLDTSSA